MFEIISFNAQGHQVDASKTNEVVADKKFNRNVVGT